MPPTFANPVSDRPISSIGGKDFWAGYADADLTRLIGLAENANHDIRIAGANLRAARGLRREVRSALFPSLEADASVTRDRLSLSQLPSTSIDQRSESHLDAGFDASWELDLFGATRRSVEAATAQLQAAQADLAATSLSVAAETARAYFEVRGLQRRIEFANRNLELQMETLGVVMHRLTAGRGTEFDVARVRGLVETTRAAIPVLQSALARTLYMLAVLTGREPGQELQLERIHSDEKVSLPIFVVEDPAALLRRRPDVAAAERRLAAASASIGVATAELFPSVTLIGSVGVLGTRGGDLSKGDALRYSAGPTLRWNVLDFGRIRSRIEQADARHDGALAAYEQTVLRALEDAEAALVAVGRTDEEAKAVAAAASASRTAARLADLRFQAGVKDLLDLLDAERQVLGAEDQLSRVRTAQEVASVALFKAMGGGWERPTVPATR